MKGRPDLYVVARFLDALAERARTRSGLQRAAGLNYDTFVRYEARLEEGGYLVRRGRVLRLSEEGRRLHRELREWLTRLFTSA